MEMYEAQTIWASVIELLHISSLVHDDIIGIYKNWFSLLTAYNKFR